MNLNEKVFGGLKRIDGTPIKCRGYKIHTHKIPHMTSTLSRSFFRGGAVVYFSCDEPIAIKYSNGNAVMLFKSLGEITVQNRLKLRETIDFRTVMEIEFNAALFDLLSRT